VPTTIHAIDGNAIIPGSMVLPGARLPGQPSARMIPDFRQRIQAS
jgi:hypothetical protein